VGELSRAAGERGRGGDAYQRILDIYIQWFPVQVRDKEVWASVRRGIEHEYGRGRIQQHVREWYEACRKIAMQPLAGQSYGAIMDEFNLRLGQAADLAETRRVTPLPAHVPDWKRNAEYGREIRQAFDALVDRKITHAAFAQRVREAAATHGGITDTEEAAVVGYERKVNERYGGLDTLANPTPSMADVLSGALNREAAATTAEGEAHGEGEGSR
jgi:hypothetical protein